MVIRYTIFNLSTIGSIALIVYVYLLILYLHMYVHVYVYVYMYVHMYVYVCVCRFVCIYAHQQFSVTVESSHYTTELFRQSVYVTIHPHHHQQPCP